MSRRQWIQLAGFGALVSTAVPQPAFADGIPIVTESQLGLLFREGAVRGAQFADSLDLKWERFSDELRDKKACDPSTGRRVFDNGFNPDGSRRGNPVLGGMCNPVELAPLDRRVADRVMQLGQDATLQVLRGESSQSLATKVSEMESRLAVIQAAEDAGKKAREAGNDATSTSEQQKVTAPTFVLPPSPTLSENELQQYFVNRACYTRFRAWGQGVPNGSARKSTAKALEVTWGGLLLDEFSGGQGREAFTSPFPTPDSVDEQPYDVERMLGLLGALSACLRRFQSAGLIGKWELSVPTDNDFEVITLAVDDDITLGAQYLLREQGAPLAGSAVTALVEAVMDRAKVVYRLDSYFVDPTTTSRQETYEPTQLLLSFSDLRSAGT